MHCRFRRGALKSNKCAPSRTALALGLWTLVWLAWPLTVGHAQEGGARRWLFVIETSRATQRRVPGISAAVKGLLDSRCQGQLRTGDKLAVWTFSGELHATEVPLLRWSPETHATVTDRLLSVLGKEAYERNGALDKVLPEIKRILEGSDVTTVILVSAGEGQMSGMPFDDAINQAWRQWCNEQRRTRMPLLTLLRSGHGQITDWSVTPAPWPIELPPLRAEVQIAKPVTDTPEKRPTRHEATPPATPPSAYSDSAVPATAVQPDPPKTQSPATISQASSAVPAASSAPTSNPPIDDPPTDPTRAAPAGAIAAAAVIHTKIERLEFIPIRPIQVRALAPIPLHEVPERTVESETASEVVPAPDNRLAALADVALPQAVTRPAHATPQASPPVRAPDLAGVGPAVNGRRHGAVIQDLVWSTILALAAAGAAACFLAWIRGFRAPQPKGSEPIKLALGPKTEAAESKPEAGPKPRQLRPMVRIRLGESYVDRQ